MKQTVPLSKQSKRVHKEYHKKQRGSWYGLSPVTRTCPNGKAYDRNKVKYDSRSSIEL
jgi:rare lipoprotein A (peptidoglycan hydrolase)